MACEVGWVAVEEYGKEPAGEDIGRSRNLGGLLDGGSTVDGDDGTGGGGGRRSGLHCCCCGYKWEIVEMGHRIYRFLFDKESVVPLPNVLSYNE